MPVNTAALKTFAPAMRRQLLEAVGRKLDLLLNSQTPDTLSTYAKQIAELREQEAENREQLLERVAYTWFNRLCALRYLDARGWHPFGCKVLMPAADGETQPELLKLMRAGSLPGELKQHTNEARLHALLDGQIQPAIAGADPQGEVYRELVLASCRSYHQLLPDLFEGLDDASELLLPDDLLSDGSITGGLRSQISDTDCEDVEIIGWLYQFYISEKKDQVIGKVVKSEDIPAATQLFTPNWIVKYMVQNSLGAQWLATYPSSALKGQMEYYIEPAEQTLEVQAQLAAITPESLDPEALTLIDPACGSGHILVEAYDLLKAIYLERGYRQRDIPDLILTKNLHGIDIDDRAVQLTAFALIMKGREDNRRLLERPIQLNIYALQDSHGLNLDFIEEVIVFDELTVRQADAQTLASIFLDACTYGSLIEVPFHLADKLPAFIQIADSSSRNFLSAGDLNRLEHLARQALILAKRYDVVVANPPYMGTGGMNSVLKKFVRQRFPDAKSDIFSCFMERGFQLAKQGGFVSMVTMQSWMFLASFERLRAKVIQSSTITTMAHIGYNSFPSLNSKVALATAFSLRNIKVNDYSGVFIDLNTAPQSADKKDLFLGEASRRLYVTKQDTFNQVPGSPLAYWVNEPLIKAFKSLPRFAVLAETRKGMVTARNEVYLRQWYEVDKSSLGLGITERAEAARSDRKWFFYNKGGEFRRWYGNRCEVVNWEDDGALLRTARHPTEDRVWATNFNLDYIFKPNISWSEVTTGLFSARSAEDAGLFDSTGVSCFPSAAAYWTSLGFLNSKVAQMMLQLINPTIHYLAGDIANLPFPPPAGRGNWELAPEELARMSAKDWNAYERSWEFAANPIISIDYAETLSLESKYEHWMSLNQGAISEAIRLERENNQNFIEAYGLRHELVPEVPVTEITLTINPLYRYGGCLADEEKYRRFRRDTMAELLSYAIGCKMGRYSLDKPGLVLADSRDSQAAQLAGYEEKVGKSFSEVQFKPDPDGIIPVLDGEWFEDDIVARTREFLAVTFPESSVAENLRFIEESLGKDIRKYFCSEFYKDHLQTYKKRPIYWLVQSPKKGFSCLIYLHRYTKDTLNQVLNNYFRPYLQKLEARLAQLGLDQLNDDLPTRERTAARKEAEKITKVLKECQAWEQDALLPLAQQRIELDLDDGVKVNYLKLQDVLAVIPGLAAKEE